MTVGQYTRKLTSLFSKFPTLLIRVGMALGPCTMHALHTTQFTRASVPQYHPCALVSIPKTTPISQLSHLPTLRLDLLPQSLATTALQHGLISSWISSACCSSSPSALARRRNSTANPPPEETDGEEGESGDQASRRQAQRHPLTNTLSRKSVRALP